ncbi:MAG: NAD(+)/NADH kinase [Bacillota bacterium]|jgi:NAD+ kinase|nr:NAD(+)/NADH kinase [Thermoanaerobacteraceae bacterium]
MIRTVGLILNPTLGERIAPVARKLISYLGEQGARVYLLEKQAPVVGAEGVTEEVLRECADALFSVGGDGTLLSTVPIAAPKGIPVLGINMGRLGFLAELGPEEIYSGVIRDVLEGCCRIEERLLLRVGVEHEGTIVQEMVCLNECVVGRDALGRSCRVEVRVGGQCVMNFNGDGVIVATPTGSTAYSFSAGGPLLEPGVEAIVLTPICPHSYTVRPVVVNAAAAVEVVPGGGSAAFRLAADGEESAALLPGDKVTIERYPRPFRLIRVSERSFYTVLREKLRLQGLESCEG